MAEIAPRASLRLRRENRRYTLPVLSLSAIVYGLLQCFAIPALPEIQRRMHASPNAVSWVMTAFLIAAAVTTPFIGRLGDMYGKQRVLVLVLGVLVLGTLVSALANSIGVLVAGRALQGVSGGLFPLGFGIIRDGFPADMVARGVALLSSCLGIGSAIGLVLAGPIVSGLGYRWLFWIPLVIAAAAAITTRLFVPESVVKSGGRVDWIGAALLSGGLVAGLVGISRTSVSGWISWPTACTLAVGAGLLGLLVIVERNRPAPLIDMTVLRGRAVWPVNVAALLLGVGMYAAFILLPQYVQEPRSTGYGFGATVTQAGIYILPMPVMLMVTGTRTAWLTHRYGGRLTLVAAVVLCSASWLVVAVAHSSPWQIGLSAGLCGAGNGIALAVLPILITANVGSSQTGVANGLNNLMRLLGGAVGGQVAATLLASSVIRGQPSEHGYTLAFAMGAATLLLALLPALAIPRHRTQSAVVSSL